MMTTLLLCSLSGLFWLALARARRALEPACPGCSAKRWSPRDTLLRCAACGWSGDPGPAPSLPGPAAARPARRARGAQAPRPARSVGAAVA